MQTATSLIRLFSVCVLTLFLVACGRGALTLAPTDHKSNNHMVSALDYNNQFTRWINELPDQPGPTSEEWLEALKLLERAIEEANLVSIDFMDRAHGDLRDMWQGFLIPSMEKTHEYHFNAVAHPESVRLPSTEEGMEQLRLLFDADGLGTIFGQWYDQNRDAIRAGIRRMAE